MSEKAKYRIASLSFHQSVDLAGGLNTAQLRVPGAPSLSSSLIDEATPSCLSESGFPCPPAAGQQATGWKLVKRGPSVDEVAYVGNHNVASVKYVPVETKK